MYIVEKHFGVFFDLFTFKNIKKLLSVKIFLIFQGATSLLLYFRIFCWKTLPLDVSQMFFSFVESVRVSKMHFWHFSIHFLFLKSSTPTTSYIIFLILYEKYNWITVPHSWPIPPLPLSIFGKGFISFTRKNPVSGVIQSIPYVLVNSLLNLKPGSVSS